MKDPWQRILSVYLREMFEIFMAVIKEAEKMFEIRKLLRDGRRFSRVTRWAQVMDNCSTEGQQE